jgi:hypothetical protein
MHTEFWLENLEVLVYSDDIFKRDDNIKREGKTGACQLDSSTSEQGFVTGC